jgi:hypothetical protein
MPYMDHNDKGAQRPVVVLQERSALEGCFRGCLWLVAVAIVVVVLVVSVGGIPQRHGEHVGGCGGAGKSRDAVTDAKKGSYSTRK